MLNEKLIRLVSDTGELLGLEETVIEKDYYVTQIIHALSGIENKYFQLIFCGGTCLAKAHKIVSRMSEDVDFKIQVKKMDVTFSKTRLMKELKEFRLYIKSKLILPDLITGDPIIRNEGQYSKIEIDYPSAFPINTGLRPHILLEFTLSNIRLAVEELSVRTLIEDNIGNTIIFAPSSTQCVSVEETAIEKWVGLTRRIVAIEREYHSDDSTLVRHIYDLNSIKSANRINANFFTLAKAIVTNDAKQFKNQHPEYSINPCAEIRQSLALLRNKPLWKERYQEFIETMVYDNTTALEYKNAINILENISARVIDSLHQ